MKAALFALLALVAITNAQFILIEPAGRGFAEDDARRGPCGYADSKAAATIDRPFWDADSNQHLTIQVNAANGGGVIVDKWSCSLLGQDATESVYPITGTLVFEVPNVSDQVYEVKVRAPSNRCAGEATVQLIYSTFDGGDYFQCLDVLINGSAVQTASLLLSTLSALLVLAFAF